jgi:hypothetical protein
MEMMGLNFNTFAHATTNSAITFKETLARRIYRMYKWSVVEDHGSDSETHAKARVKYDWGPRRIL